jgi:DNA-damage-inducible protein D
VDETNLPASENQSFENLKHLNEHGAEYWSARELQVLFGYSQWRRFEDAIKRAITSCEQSGNVSDHHFAGVGKMVDLGSGSVREIPDYHLSRFACYLIAQNGDPRKPEIAQAQKYFAIQTRRMELSDALAADLERLETRKQTSEEFKSLSGAVS